MEKKSKKKQVESDSEEIEEPTAKGKKVRSKKREV